MTVAILSMGQVSDDGVERVQLMMGTGSSIAHDFAAHHNDVLSLRVVIVRSRLEWRPS